MDHVVDRPHYQPSGRVDPLRTPIGLLILAASAFGVGLLLELLLLHVFYVGIFYALFAGLLVSGVLYLVVRESHIRNRPLGAGAGVLAGMLAYGSYFHCDQCLRLGHAWTDVANLSDHVQFRMQTDELIGHGKGFEVRPAPVGQFAMQRPPREQWMNWISFGVDMLSLSALPFYFGLKATGTPYSERRGRWLECARVVCRPEVVPELLEALRHRRLAEWANQPLMPVAPGQPHRRIGVWYCPVTPGEAPEWLVYINVGDLKHLRLSPEETAALLPIFPGLMELAFPASAADLEPAPAAADSAAAHFWKVPKPYGGRLLTPANAVVINVLLLVYQLIPLMLLFLHIGLVGLLVKQVGNGIDGAALAVYALGGALAPLFVLRRLNRAQAELPVSTRYYRWQFRRQLAQRPEVLVHADEPNACFVEIVPRRNWGKITLESAADMGFLQVDFERREMRFEGDHERWIVRGATIIRCAVELMPSATSANDGRFIVIGRVQQPEGERELPIFPRTGLGRDHAERAEKLLLRISELQAEEPAAVRSPGGVD
jgi:hypothetical protein